MITNTAETLSKGMKILSEQMGIIEAERFLFLVKAEGFDYTTWQRDYFSTKSKEEIDAGIDAYFADNPYSGNPAKLL